MPISSPKVSAVMLTGHLKGREALARASMRCFMEQSYLDRELVIINSGAFQLVKEPLPGVREIVVAPGLNHGALWNVGLEHAEGDWIIGWDDDDWHHPHRITFQMAARREGCCVALQSYLFVDPRRNYVTVHEDVLGLSGTMLFPRDTYRFPEDKLHSDATFYQVNFKSKDLDIVLDNDADDWPGTSLYVRSWWGDNNSGESNRLRIVEGGQDDRVTAEHTNLLREIMPDYYGIPVAARRKIAKATEENA